MKRILLPTDFSDNSFNAMRYAVQLFENETCTFYVLNTFTPVSFTAGYLIENPTPYGLEDVGMINSKREIEAIENRIIKEFPSSRHSFVRLSAFDTLLSGVKEVIDKYDIDLIIMGTKGATGAKELFLGSNTHRLIKNIDECPILLVPETCNYQKIKNIAFANNLERVYYKSEIAPITYLAKKNDAIIKMIHIHNEPKRTAIQNYNISSLEQYFKQVEFDFYEIPESSTIENAIRLFIEESNIDMLIMINYKHSFMDRLLREPIIKKITFHTEIPFFVIPADN